MTSLQLSDAPMTAPAVVSRIEGDAIWITLNRPARLNAMNGPLVKELSLALRDASSDASARVIVLHGAGRAFCSGDDLKEIGAQAASPGDAEAWIDAIQEITHLIMRSDKVVIAAVHGWCVGGALEWAMNCDFRLFADSTRWFFPEVSLGLFVTGGITSLLTKQVGPQVAKELMMLGERHDARTALRLGIAWKVVPEAELIAETRTLATAISARPSSSITEIKHAINNGFHSSLAEAMVVETRATVRAFLSVEAKERVGGFLGKR